MIGTVKWFNEKKGYGFITIDPPIGGDVFVHYTGIKGIGYRSLEKGDRVEFSTRPDEGVKGPYAVEVEKISAQGAA